MTDSSTPQGYQCRFIDNVPEDFYCKKCSLVARKLTITSCCGESYCKDCILPIKQDNKPCPGCRIEAFETFPQAKSQKNILLLKAYCPFKERGCQWCDMLEKLDVHLHPDDGDCEHADIHCPLKCNQLIDRKHVNDHTANECVKRDYICPYCAFKATYEIVSTIHWAECSYYPLRCPNCCGVTCERPTMEDHIKICPLQVVECAFQHFGCSGKFSREEEEEHMREKSQTHLTMMAAASVKMKQEFEGKLQEQEKRFDEQKKRFEEQVKGLEETLKQEVFLQIQELENKFSLRLQSELQVQQKAIEEIKEEAARNKLKIETPVPYVPIVPQKFMLYNFKEARRNRDDWKSPLMYTHTRGYKFCLSINPSGVSCEVLAVRGEYDDQLKWPVEARFTIELVNHYPNGHNKVVELIASWNKPMKDYSPTGDNLDYCSIVSSTRLSRNDEWKTEYLLGDALYFNVIGITFF